MTQQHRQAADQAMVLDAPRILRKDITAVTELVAKYQGLEAALNGVGHEAGAEAVSGLVVPLTELRVALEQAVEAVSSSSAPSLPGVDPGQSEQAQQAAFDLEDALMAFIQEHNRLPETALLRKDVYDLFQQAFPGQTALKLAKGVVQLREVFATDDHPEARFHFAVGGEVVSRT